LHCLFGRQYFHIFLPITGKEVDCRVILHLLSGKTKYHFKPILKLERYFLLTDNTKIKRKNEYNIQNPLTESEVPSNKIEVVYTVIGLRQTRPSLVGYGKVL
jgi:hypothetical protein